MNTMRRLCLLCLLWPALVSAQRSVEAGLFAGIAQYQGDLAPSPFAFSESNLAIGGVYRYFFDSRFAMKGTVNYGRITGDDRNRPNYRPGSRTWQMENNIFEMAVHTEWIPFAKPRYGSTGLFKGSFSPYVSVGLGAAFTNPKLTIPTEDRRRQLEPKATTTFLVVPITGGFRFDITEDFTIAAEFGTRATFSDYIDGVSINGNPKTNDWYIFTGISLIYVIEELVGGKAGR